MVLRKQMAELLEDMREPASSKCHWRRILSKHTTNRPKGEEAPLVSIASCSEKETIPGTDDGLTWHRFTIKAGAAFFPGDGVTWQLTAWAESAHAAEEGCCLHGVALLLLLDAPNFRLLDKDWVGGAQVVTQKGHDMMHTWLFNEAAQWHLLDGIFFEAVDSRELCQDCGGKCKKCGEMCGKCGMPNGVLPHGACECGYWQHDEDDDPLAAAHRWARAFGPKVGQVKSQNPTTKSKRNRGYRCPGANYEGLPPDEERDEQICGLLRAMLDGAGGTSIKMSAAPGGKKYGPRLGALLPPGSLRTWLANQDQFEIKVHADGTWELQYCADSGDGGNTQT